MLLPFRKRKKNLYIGLEEHILIALSNITVNEVVESEAFHARGMEDRVGAIAGTELKDICWTL